MKVVLHTYNIENPLFTEVMEDLTFLGDMKGFQFKTEGEGHVDYRILVGDNDANPNGFDTFIKLIEGEGESRDMNTVQLTKGNVRTGSYWSKLNSVIKRVEFNTKDYSGVVVLPTCSPKLYRYRDAIAQELRQHGFDVRFGYNTLLEDEMPILSIHLIGGEVTPELMEAIEADNKGCVELYKKLNGRNGFRRFLFYPDVTNQSDEVKSVEWDNFKRQKENLIGADLLELTLEKFKTELFKSLNTHLSLNQKTMDTNSLVYLSFNRASDVEEMLNRNTAIKQYRVLGNKEVGALSLKQYKDEMNTADVVVLHVDDAPIAWVASKLDDIIKSNGYRQLQTRVKLVLVGDIDITELPQLNLVDYKHVKNETEMVSNQLVDFLTKVEENA